MVEDTNILKMIKKAMVDDKKKQRKQMDQI
jgi:hypothetical protein